MALDFTLNATPADATATLDALGDLCEEAPR